MAQGLALTPLLTGDPARPGPDVSTPVEILAALGVAPGEPPGVLELTPRVALVHSLTGVAGGLAIHVAHLAHAPRLAAGGGPVELAVVLVAGIADLGVALRLASRLKAGLRDLAPLAFAEWWILLPFPPVMLLAEEARKWVSRWARPR
jgi:hypothetical protein